MTIIGIILLVFACALVAIGVLAWMQRLPGNSYIGIRIPEVRKSQEMWNTAHKMAGPLWVAGGISLIFAALLCFTQNLFLGIFAALLVIASVVLVSLGASAGARTVSLITAANEKDSQCCSAGGDTADTSTNQNSSAPTTAPEVDIAAARRAAQRYQDSQD